MSGPDDPLVPVRFKLRASTLALVDALAERLRLDREVCALNVRGDRDTMLRLAIERGAASIEKGLTLRVLRRDHADILDPVALFDVEQG